MGYTRLDRMVDLIVHAALAAMEIYLDSGHFLRALPPPLWCHFLSPLRCGIDGGLDRTSVALLRYAMFELYDVFAKISV